MAPGLLILALVLAAAPRPGLGQALSPTVARHVDAQLADLGSPAFVDGFAGLLLAHAGRDPTRARAMAARVLTRAPAAGPQVATALKLAGFDPAVAGLSAPDRPTADARGDGQDTEGRAGDQRRPDDPVPDAGLLGDGVPDDGVADDRAPDDRVAVGSAPDAPRSGEPADPGAAEYGSADDGTHGDGAGPTAGRSSGSPAGAAGPNDLSAGATLRPGPAGLATPQLR